MKQFIDQKQAGVIGYVHNKSCLESIFDKYLDTDQKLTMPAIVDTKNNAFLIIKDLKSYSLLNENLTDEELRDMTISYLSEKLSISEQYLNNIKCDNEIGVYKTESVDDVASCICGEDSLPPSSRGKHSKWCKKHLTN